jgi:hypothetical protein
MFKFRVGDKVQRVSGSYKDTLEGGHYVVTGVDGPGYDIRLNCSDGDTVYDARNFALVLSSRLGVKSAAPTSWDYAEAQRLQDIAKQAVKEYNDYVDRKPGTVFLKLADY